ncbi:MAG: hypothetical protein J6O53_02670 [Eubacterium sp.]|nr:hypothetical protein [Eubacterium sp.]
MDEQNLNGSENKYSMATDPYGAEQNPYGAAQQNPYGAGQNPYGAAGQNPYGAGQTPYGGAQQNPYGAEQGACGTNGNPYGAEQGAYGTNGNPYGAQQGAYGTNGNPYGAQQGAYGTNGNPYGAQQGGNPYGAGQNPYASANGAPIVPPKPPRKKMSKKAKILIFGGVGLAAVAVAAVFLCLYVFFPAKKTVKAAIDGMLSSDNVVSKSVLMKELGMDTLSQNFAREGGQIKLDLTMDGEAVSSQKTGVDAELDLDKAAKKLSGELELERNGEKFVEAELFADEERTYVTVKDLMKGYLSVTNKDILNSIMNSPLGKEMMSHSSVSMPSNIPKIDLNFFAESNSINMEAFTSDDNVLWKDSKVGREGSEKLAIGSEMVSAKKYSVTIPKETLKNLVENYMDVALNAAGNTQFGSIDPSQIKSLMSGIFKDDFVYYVYVLDDKVISIKANGKLTVVMYSLDYNIDFVNYSSDTQNTLSFSLSLGMGGMNAIEAKFSSITKNEGDQLKTDVTLTLTAANTAEISGSYSQTYNKSAKTFSGSGSLTQSGNSIGKIALEGKVEEQESGKKLKLQLDNFAISSSSGQEIMKLEGSIEIKTKDGGIEVESMDSSKPVVKIEADSKEEIKAIIDPESEEYKKFIERFRKAMDGAGLDKYLPDDF